MSLQNETEDNWFRGQTELKLFETEYRPFHAYISLVISVFGIIGNSLNVFILTRKEMISAMNILLTALAVTEGLKLTLHLTFIVLFFFVYDNALSPLVKVSYAMFYFIVAIVFHTASIWLTVSLAIFRYIAIRFPLLAATLCSRYRAKVNVVIVCFLVTVMCIPNSLSYSYVSNNSDNVTNWHITVIDGTEGNNFIRKLNLWFSTFFVRLLPCLLLLWLSFLLIQELRRAAERSSNLRSQENDDSDDTIQKRTETNRTTGMLVIVVVLFIVIELPHGILLILVATNRDYFYDVYHPLGDLIDDITLLNNGINFVIYCTMSKKFRDTFIAMFSCSKVNC
ncbi:G-protein coupled receptor [Biomphalaria pfeifferi]|uniref:G-protein coupled receptor n=1 Tax=Biomphalaria pfeifferi TaxID=112525 RepID=A0AAD8F624_BIOPF|nr:G-protein coupled receptor [Biomphalaria pfeifferi]